MFQQDITSQSYSHFVLHSSPDKLQAAAIMLYTQVCMYVCMYVCVYPAECVRGGRQGLISFYRSFLNHIIVDHVPISPFERGPARP